MNRVILASVERPQSGRSVVDWAAREAALHGLPMRTVFGTPADPAQAKMIVCGVTRGTAGTVGALGVRLPTAPATDRPLVLVPDGPAAAHPSGDVVLGMDARDPRADAIEFAFDCARVRGARLCAVHAWSLPSDASEWPFGVPEKDRATWEDLEVQLLADALRPWREKYSDVPVLEDVVLLTPAQALLHRAASAALVVVGEQDTEWGETLMSVLHQAACPVAVVPARATP